MNDVYISPNFISNHNLPDKPTFQNEDLEYFSNTINPSYSFSYSLKETSYPSELNSLDYHFTWPNILYINDCIFSLYDNYSTHYSSFSVFGNYNPFFRPFHFDSPFCYTITSISNFNNYYSCTNRSSNSSRQKKYSKPSKPHQQNQSKAHYNLAKTSNYNYKTNQKAQSSSGHYHDPRISQTPTYLTQPETYDYSPYTPTNNTSQPNTTQSNTTYTAQKQKPQQTPATPNTSTSKKPNNTPIYQQKPTAQPAIPK
jgi:hypothetical protein